MTSPLIILTSLAHFLMWLVSAQGSQFCNVINTLPRFFIHEDQSTEWKYTSIHVDDATYTLYLAGYYKGPVGSFPGELSRVEDAEWNINQYET